MATPDSSSDEIDLKKLLLEMVLIAKRNAVLIVTFFVIGTLLGFLYGMLGTKIYESKMLASSDMLSDPYIAETGENFNNLLKDGNIDLLAKRLSLSIEQAKKIRSIELDPAEKQSEKSGAFLLSVTVDVLDPGIFPDLQKGIINYLENNEFVKTRIDQRKKVYVEMSKKMDEEIVSLEEFKREIYNGNYLKKINGNMMFDPTTVNSKILALTNERLSLKNALEVANSIQLIEGFTEYKKPARPKQGLSLAAGASLGIFLVILLIIFKSLRSLVRTAEANQNLKG